MGKPDAVTTRHPFDYVYQEGMQLRPAPTRGAQPSWPILRDKLYSEWMEIGNGWQDTPQTRLLDDHMWESDPVMDAVTALFESLGAPRVRAMFEQALEHGIETVEDAPQPLLDLFAHLDRKPDWYDEETCERGRLLLCETTDLAKLAATAFGLYATAFEEDVSAATGATGWIARQPVKRAVENQEFFEGVTYAGALKRDSEMFKMIIRVRLMHSLARRGLRRRLGDEYFVERGMPISNSNMAAGSAWFATMPPLIDHVYGRPVTKEQLDDVAVHWGYILYLFGVHERIIPTRWDDSIALANHAFASAGEPAAYREGLVDGLLKPIAEASGVEAGRLGVTMIAGSIGALLGDEAARRFFGEATEAEVDLDQAVLLFEGAMRAAAAEAKSVDADPEASAARRAAAAVGDPGRMQAGIAIRQWGADNGIKSSPFTSHDGSTTGSTFAAPAAA